MISVVMCTYNGAAFIKQQLESILTQTLRPDELLIQDDGSKDKTIAIIETFAKTAPFPIHLKVNEQNVGACKNFERALMRSNGDYIFLCDQDDVWHEDKIKILVSEIKQLESTLPNLPVLAFTDLNLIDKNGTSLNTTFHSVSGYKYRKDGHNLLLRNHIPGCSMAMNRNVLTEAFKTTNFLKIHDYWLLYVTILGGQIVQYSKPLVQYRLHDNNAIGLKIPHRKNQWNGMEWNGMEWNGMEWKKELKIILSIAKYIFSPVRYRANSFSDQQKQLQEIQDKLLKVLPAAATYIVKKPPMNPILRMYAHTKFKYKSSDTWAGRLRDMLCF